MIKSLSKFLYILKDQKKKLFILVLLVLVTSVLDTLGIGFVGSFIALASSSDFIHKNYWLNWLYTQLSFQSTNQFISCTALLILSIFYVKSYVSFRLHHSIHKFSFEQEGKLRSKLLHSYLSAPYTFHLGINTAVVVHNIITETQKFCMGVMLPGLQFAANVTILGFILLLLINTNLLATVVVFGILLLAASPYYLFQDKIVLWGKEKSIAQKEMIRIINHSLGGLKESWVIGCNEYFENQMNQQSKKFAEAASLFSVFKFLPRVVIEPLLVTFLVALVVISLLGQGTNNLFVELGIFTTAAIRLMPVVSLSMTEFSQIRNSSYALSQLYYDLKNLEQFTQNNLEKRALRGHSFSDNSFSVESLYRSSQSNGGVMPYVNQITLEAVTYRYPKASVDTVKNISLSITKGQSIALIGKSGAGKTTLVDIILGLLTSDSGDIKVDGTSIYKDLRSWQNLVGYIPQFIFLTDDTIARNIAFGVPDELIDFERLNKAIQAAHLTELVQQLPDSLQTVIGERGVRLSGGQRQRIGIARALYHEREILILDEATAALDTETENRVTAAINALSGKKTLIIIAHRLTTIQHCDCVYLLDGGRIVKSGSYQEVVLEEQAA